MLRTNPAFRAIRRTKFGNQTTLTLDVLADDFFEYAPLSITRGHDFKLYKKNHSTATVRAKFFSERIVSVWNNLPDSVDFSKLASFIRTVKTVDFSKYLRYS